jgi:uncharacterized protein YbaR (Trm112 family)
MTVQGIPMLNRCPHCQQPLQFTGEQTAHLKKVLLQLAPDKTLIIKCPLCRAALPLDKSGNMQSKNNHQVQPPPPPNLDWLKSDLYQGEEKVEDVPMALVFHNPDEQRQRICKALESVGYQVFMADSVDDAMDRMRFVNFACVVLHTDTEENLKKSLFHNHMRDLPMERRRYIFYILIGDTFHTLYNLEALAHSANLTVHTTDIPHLDVILRKAIPAYEELFGPFLEELNAYGKH